MLSGSNWGTTGQSLTAPHTFSLNLLNSLASDFYFYFLGCWWFLGLESATENDKITKLHFSRGNFPVLTFDSFKILDGGLQRSVTLRTSQQTSSTCVMRLESSPCSSLALKIISGHTRAESFLTWRGTGEANTNRLALGRSLRMVTYSLFYYLICNHSIVSAVVK